MTSETIYDEQILPLMRQVMAKCEENKIPMLAAFAFFNEAKDPMRGLLSTGGKGFEGDTRGFSQAHNVLKNPPLI